MYQRFEETHNNCAVLIVLVDCIIIKAIVVGGRHFLFIVFVLNYCSCIKCIKDLNRHITVTQY